MEFSSDSGKGFMEGEKIRSSTLPEVILTKQLLITLFYLLSLTKYQKNFMKAVIQRAERAAVRIDGKEVGAIGRGILLLLGIHGSDGERDVQWLAEKSLNLRIFEDEEKKMNLSLKDIAGEMLIVSQFTLYGDCRKGRRPGFSAAAAPSHAEPLYEKFIEEIRRAGISTACGVFGADMKVELINDGPVTLLLDTGHLQ